MSIDMKWLEQQVLLRELASEERTALKCLQEEAFSAGQKIITEGQPGGMLYILRSGKASVEDSNRYEGRINIADVEEGALFGEMTFLNNQMATADVTASEDCVVYKLSHTDFSDLMREQQQLAYSIFTLILNHQSKVILSMKVRLMPMLRNLKKKAAKLPLAIKLLPVIFILLYILAFFYISWKDFSY
ncbi:MAG: cyclic nucleotide-binding domain-containing protein [Mariprofundaceae bacterium]